MLVISILSFSHNDIYLAVIGLSPVNEFNLIITKLLLCRKESIEEQSVT